MPQTTEQSELTEKFSLLGGPLYRLGCRLGLVQEGTTTTRMGLALGALLWTVLVALTLIVGAGRRLFTLEAIGAHTRLLVVIPLLFACESWVAPRAAMFVSMIAGSGVVARNALPALRSEIGRNGRWKDSWLPEVVCLLMAALAMLASDLPMSATKFYGPRGTANGITIAGHWYWIVCITLLRFLMLRWIWRLALWTYFLWRVANLKLNLVPTHPDRAAGLGYLEVVHMHFTPLVLAISILQCSSYAEEIWSGAMTFEAIYSSLAIVLVADAVLFLGPLFVFYPKLWSCRVKGLSDYMSFADNYVRSFDRKWLGAGSPPGEPLLGTPDLQSLADLGNSVRVVSDMRLVPVSKRLLLGLAISAIVPALPLLLLKYPIADLIQTFFGRLTGL